jgi:UDP-N-acetylmuramoyl-L-alanyl-D-glutamate--2,6-diaminopimelate ligase
MKTLRELTQGLQILGAGGGLDIPVSGLCYDSRQAEEGSLFVCIPGQHTDGHNFIYEAVSRGAVGIVAQTEMPVGLSTGFVRVGDSRAALAAISANFYGHPASSLDLIGITGTNGKTTTSLLIESILRSRGSSPGVLGTLAYRWAGKQIPAPMTTPESLDLQRLFSRMLLDGVSHVVMEVSSHAIALGRIAGCEFRTAVFTNLSQDHLDFHSTMEEYFAVKKLLFSSYLAPNHSVAVVNEDDDYGKRIIENGTSASKIIRYSGIIAGKACPGPRSGGLEAGAHPGSGPAQMEPCRPRDERGVFAAGTLDKETDRVFAEDVRFSPRGITAKVHTPLGQIQVDSPLLGRLNLYNILAAISAAVSMDVEPKAIEDGIRTLSQVAGRLERVAIPDHYGFQVVVDYAHTPDAMEKALVCVREMTEKRLIALFGCGGDRDRGKRPIMGRIAAELADLVIITSDNPRSEPPDDILDEIEAGVKRTGTPAFKPGGEPPGGKGYIREVDRRKAIEIALALGRAGDMIFIGGKGHETYQIVGNIKHAFDDRLVVREYYNRGERSDREYVQDCSGAG